MELHEYMLTQNKLQKGGGMLNSFDPKVGRAQRRRKMENEEARWEEEHNFHKVFYIWHRKWTSYFSENEQALGHEKKDADDNGSTNHEGGGEEPPPSPSSSDGSHHSNHDSKHTSKKPFFKLDIKFDLPMYNGECSAKNFNNCIRQIKVYFQIQNIK